MANIVGGSNIVSYHPIYGDKAVCQGQNCLFCRISDRMQLDQDHLLGKVLTVIDASIPSGEQQKAVKDLIKSIFYDKFREMDEGMQWSVHCLWVDGKIYFADKNGLGVLGQTSMPAFNGIDQLPNSPESYKSN